MPHPLAEQDADKLGEICLKQAAKIEQLKKALEFYAYSADDGHLARKALGDAEL